MSLPPSRLPVLANAVPFSVAKHTPDLIERADDAVRELTALGSARDIAVDTEGASFHRFVDRVYLLQLSTRERHAIIDPLPMGVPPGLGALLEDPAVEVVFHDADYDLRGVVGRVVIGGTRSEATVSHATWAMSISLR